METLADYVADMLATCRQHVVMSADYAKNCMSARHDTGKRRPRHTQFVSIKADIFKSAQTYEYRSYSTFFMFELKKQSFYCRHCRHVATCRQMSCRLVPRADMKCRCDSDMTSDMSPTRRRHDTFCRQKRKKTTRHKTTLSAKPKVPTEFSFSIGTVITEKY